MAAGLCFIYIWFLRIVDRCPHNAVSAPYGVAEYLRLPLTGELAPIGD